MIYWEEDSRTYIGTGLIDLQINGIKEVDFNDPKLTIAEVQKATSYLLSRGVTSFFPTIITNSEKRTATILNTLIKAIERYPVVKESIGGIHLEGPFISPREGAIGAHDAQFVVPPDWELIKRFQKVAKGHIKLITLAPEWEGTERFIKQCKKSGILVSMGHSLAETREVKGAVEAGLALSTHLGNAIPLKLQRHPNILWDQLAEERLYAMIIADGHHVPDSFIQVVMKVKEEKTILVSDATKFAGMPSGAYKSTIGGDVVLDAEKKLSLKRSKGLLAGAAKDLLENVETMVCHQLASLEEAWGMATDNVTAMLQKELPAFKLNNDKVRFKMNNGNIIIKEVFKDEELVYKSK